ncbi:MAG: cytochrome c maturation protein CcmE [Planctomycetes bacterium]|nr:cytochrome c maturation protein CcmE [Planctomycetota bacterium]
MSAKLIIVIALFVAAVGGAVTLALLEGGIEYRTIPEITSSNYEGQRVKVRGQVLNVQSEFKPTRFTAMDIPAEGQTAPADPRVIQVIYEGDDVPQGLKKGAHVTMEGRFDSKRGAFVATLLQTQCPSRYQGKELTTADEVQPAP